MNLSIPRKISKSNLMMIADMGGAKVKKHQKKDELFKILKKYTMNQIKHSMNHQLNQ